jgi:hypothetical protein
MTLKKSYAFDYDKSLVEFLNQKGIKTITGDADITLIELEVLGGYNDTPFIDLILEFSAWLRHNQG